MTHDVTRARRELEFRPRQQERLTRTIVVLGTVAAIAGISFVAATRDHADAGSVTAVQSVGVADPAALAAPAADADSAVDVAADATVPDLAISDTGELTADCRYSEMKSLAFGDTGFSVECLQQALIREGFYSGAITGDYDYATSEAVKTLQTGRDLFVDGVAGRETGISLDIWPDEEANVIHTPPPPSGAMDSMGYRLSSVSSTGNDAPPLPENSGSGRRVVYERAGQRVWAVADDGTIIRSWLVTGSQYNNEVPGTWQVYSRSEQSTAWNGWAILPYMIRYYKTQIGAIGFHGIPTHVSDGTAYQTEAELGTRMSGGCQRQANPDAAFMWYFATVGTTVVVV